MEEKGERNAGAGRKRNGGIGESLPLLGGCERVADNKKYYYLKLKDNFFDNDSMVVLESMQDGYIYSNILLKLYLKSLKDDGRLMLSGRIPYNSSTLAMVTRHSVGDVERAIKAFQELDIVEILDNGAIYMTDIQNFIGQSSTEADRKRAYRNRIENEKRGQLESQDSNAYKAIGQMSDKCPDKSPPERELERELETELETHTERDMRARASKPTLEYFDEFWEKYPKKLARKKAQESWGKLKPDSVLTGEIIAGVKAWAQSSQWMENGGKYIPYPSTFLNQERWKETPQAAGSVEGLKHLRAIPDYNTEPDSIEKMRMMRQQEGERRD